MTDKLKLGKGVAFVKSQLRRLRQEDETWEADFRALPQPSAGYLGLVLMQPDGFLVAATEVEHSPTVNDLATLLAHAMKRPLVEGHHRPRRILLRRNPEWQPLLPALKELGIEVVIREKLRKVDEAFDEFVQKPAGVEHMFPAIAKWVKGYGHIEVGDQDGFGFIVRAIDYGGVVFEDDSPRTLAEAMAALEDGLARWFENE